MGLDMYLDKMPRHDKATAREISLLESYIDYKEACGNPGSEARNCSMKEWCGVDEKDVPLELLEFYKSFYDKKYSAWDTEKRFGFCRITENVAYWRKANAIHDWFVNHVQDGVDDCAYHDEVTKDILESLLETCEKVLSTPKLATELLPTTEGFFFGSTDYDRYYYEDVKYTAETVREILETTDFEKEMLYYISSW